jgi:dephospho-CoA kinase
MSKKIVLFNGPPGCGKDTVAEGLRAVVDCRLVKFAGPIKENCRNIYGLSVKQWAAIDGSQEEKEKPREEFFGETCRQVQINFSELFLKPTHGEDIFGKLAINEIKKSRADTILISDSGFRREAEVLVEEFGNQNVLLVRLHREGKSFDGDSRNYIDLDDLEVTTYDLFNDSTIEDFVFNAEQILKKEGIL